MSVHTGREEAHQADLGSMDERQSVEDRPSSFTAKGLFDLSFENEGANRSSVSDIWNVSSRGVHSLELFY